MQTSLRLVVNMNKWPDDTRRAMTQAEHAHWNASNYPGTRQLCVNCDGVTGRCEEDSIYYEGHGPLCEECQAVLKVNNLGGVE